MYECYCKIFFVDRKKVSTTGRKPYNKELQAEGMNIHYTEDVLATPKDVDYVIYTPAVPEDHKELVYYRQHGYNVVKRSDILQLITESSLIYVWQVCMVKPLLLQ